MAKPSSREELKEYCLRKLGKPVIEINVNDTQLEDRIDEGLQLYQEYHYDGVEKVYEKHQLTAGDIAKQYISVPSPGWSNTSSPHTSDAYIGITRIFDAQGSSTGMFDIRYQMRLQDLTTFGYGGGYDLLTYSMRQQHLALMSEMLTGKIPIRFQKHKNELHLEWDWASDAVVGEYIIIEGYKIIDPDSYTDVYNDMFLKQYITALFKEQWGMNLTKFDGVQLPGGVTLNGARILDEARQDLKDLREELSLRYELPVDFMMN